MKQDMCICENKNVRDLCVLIMESLGKYISSYKTNVVVYVWYVPITCVADYFYKLCLYACVDTHRKFLGGHA